MSIFILLPTCPAFRSHTYLPKNSQTQLHEARFGYCCFWYRLSGFQRIVGKTSDNNLWADRKRIFRLTQNLLLKIDFYKYWYTYKNRNATFILYYGKFTWANINGNEDYSLIFRIQFHEKCIVFLRSFDFFLCSEVVNLPLHHFYSILPATITKINPLPGYIFDIDLSLSWPSLKLKYWNHFFMNNFFCH